MRAGRVVGGDGKKRWGAMREITVSCADFRRNERQGCSSLRLEPSYCSNGALEMLPLDKVCGGGDLGTDVAAVG